MFIWGKALDKPPAVEFSDYGWEKNFQTRSYQPIALSSTKKPAPDQTIKIVCCDYAAEAPCKIKLRHVDVCQET